MAATATGKSVSWPSGCKAALHSASQTTTLLVSLTIQAETIQTPALCPRPRRRVTPPRESAGPGVPSAREGSGLTSSAKRVLLGGPPQARPGQTHPHLNMETLSQLPFQHPCLNSTRIPGLVPSLLGVLPRTSPLRTHRRPPRSCCLPAGTRPPTDPCCIPLWLSDAKGVIQTCGTSATTLCCRLTAESHGNTEGTRTDGPEGGPRASQGG